MSCKRRDALKQERVGAQSSSSCEEGRHSNMLPTCLATHRAAQRSPVHDDAVAAGSAAVLGPLALPASPRRDHASLDLGVLRLAHQGDQLRIVLAQLNDQPLIAIDSATAAGDSDVSGIAKTSARSHCVTFGRSSCWRFRAELGVSAERDGFRPVAEPPSKDSPSSGGSIFPSERVGA
jgi:hypothetical protein